MKKIKLDEFERSIENALKRGEFIKAPNFATTKRMFEETALIKVKAKAKRNNIPYQTLLNTLIRQFAEGWAALQF